MVNRSIVGAIALAASNFEAFPFSPGFDIQTIVDFTQNLPTHSWEYGTYTEALLEIYNPELSVYGPNPFPIPSFSVADVKALSYLQLKVTNMGSGYSALHEGDGAAGDPASMGVGAVLIGKSVSSFATAAAQTIDGLLNGVPRFSNGAISQRADVAELWADFMSMVPPFLAFYAADKQDGTLLKEAVTQCQLYRDVLQYRSNDQFNGAWHHIVGPNSQDLGLWSTGNGWAASGMARVLATVMKSNWLQDDSWKGHAKDQLTQYIKEIIDAVIQAPQDEKLVRNYLNNYDTWNGGFGEISGSSHIAATIYRMAVLRPDVFGQNYITWADSIRQTLGGRDSRGASHITPAGVVTPAVNPLAWQDTTPFTAGSPEGNSFVMILYAAWRDCVSAQVCASAAGGTSPAPRTSLLKPTNKCPSGRHALLRRALLDHQGNFAKRHTDSHRFHH